MPTVYKKGKWNPLITLLERDEMKESESLEIMDDGSVKNTNKNLIRAAITNNF